MPGFIVTHTHMPYVLGHNMPVDFSQLRSFWDMLQKMGWEWLEDITTAEGIYAATRYAAAKMLKSGTTTVCELVEGPERAARRARRQREGHRGGGHPGPARLRGDRADPRASRSSSGSTPPRPRRPSTRTCA